MDEFDTLTPPENAPLKPSQQARQWAMLCHLAAFAGLVVPFGNLLGPLIVWQLKKDIDPFVDAQGKEALNFQITITIAMLICIVLTIVIIGGLLAPIVGLLNVIFCIIAAVKANNGEAYRYPFALRLIK